MGEGKATAFKGSPQQFLFTPALSAPLQVHVLGACQREATEPPEEKVKKKNGTALLRLTWATTRIHAVGWEMLQD